ncbi:hypothetical protein DPEC_G00198280 [Dallia pectoralis]|uniref:Uncharacterized protein n=1 Tax=Dallia pectoralis TaxID=75939 RepID=A0ACC2G8H8_DALPE|nr:hypothetical protein DPEC_G00198280 [Dallia pectoralis]
MHRNQKKKQKNAPTVIHTKTNTDLKHSQNEVRGFLTPLPSTTPVVPPGGGGLFAQRHRPPPVATHRHASTPPPHHQVVGVKRGHDSTRPGFTLQRFRGQRSISCKHPVRYHLPPVR